jgi:hypothetical protein
MIANGYHRLSPCPFQTQGIMLNPDGGMFFCENSDVVGNALTEDAEEVYFKATQPGTPGLGEREEVPVVPEPVPDERRGCEAVAPVREFLVRASAEEAKTSQQVAAAAAAQSSAGL